MTVAKAASPSIPWKALAGSETTVDASPTRTSTDAGTPSRSSASPHAPPGGTAPTKVSLR